MNMYGKPSPSKSRKSHLTGCYRLGGRRITAFTLSPNMSILILLLLVFIGLLYSNIVLIISHRTQLAGSSWTDLYSEIITPNFGWPPRDPRKLLKSDTGFYNVTLPVRVDSLTHATMDKVQAYVDYLFQLNSSLRSLDVNLSLKYLIKLDEEIRVRNTYPNYDLYPQWLDLSQVVTAVKYGQVVRQAPINNPELLIHQIPRNVCDPDSQEQNPHDLVVIIKSCVFCSKERNHVRQTFAQQYLWTNITIGIVFAVGQPVFSKTMNYTFYGHTIVYENKVPDTSELEVFRALEEESQQYGDLLIGSFSDTYYNLTLKQIVMYRWASIFCKNRAKLFLFMDQDYALIPENVEKFVHEMPTEIKTHVIVGVKYRNIDFIHRPSHVKKPGDRTAKWVVAEEEIPWSRYPPFLPGTCLVIGTEVVQDISIAHAFTRNYRIDDAYLGIVLYKLNRFPTVHKGFMLHNIRLKNLDEAICLPQTEADRLFDWTKGSPKARS